MKWFALFLALFSLTFACATPVKNEAVATLAPTATTPVISAPAVSCNVCMDECLPECTPPIVECPPNTGMDAACLATFETSYISMCYSHFQAAKVCCDQVADDWRDCVINCQGNQQCIGDCLDDFLEGEKKCNNNYDAEHDFNQEIFISLVLEHCCLPNLVAQGVDVTNVAAMEEYRMSLMSTAYELFKADQYLVKGSR